MVERYAPDPDGGYRATAGYPAMLVDFRLADGSRWTRRVPAPFAAPLAE